MIQDIVYENRFKMQIHSTRYSLHRHSPFLICIPFEYVLIIITEWTGTMLETLTSNVNELI